jgi:hypothetical protein
MRSSLDAARLDYRTIMQFKLSRFEVGATVLFWLLGAVASVATLYFEPNLRNVQFDWSRVATKHGAWALYWVALTLLCVMWYRTRPITRGRLRRGLTSLALCALPALALLLMYSALVHVTLIGSKSWWAVLRSLWSPDLIYPYLKICAVALAANAYHFYQRTIAEERARSQLQLRLATTELMLFRTQLQPHFLFNTLNSISSLVRLQRNAAAIEAVGQLSQLLRYVLDVGQRQVMPLSWELEFTQLYLRLQQLRFGERLTTEIDLAGVPAGTPVPVMLLQPLVENAIQHGALMDARACRITVHIAHAAQHLNIEVRNPLGRALRTRDGAGLGLANLAARLQALYGANHEFSYAPDAGEFVVAVSFPVGEAVLIDGDVVPA